MLPLLGTLPPVRGPQLRTPLLPLVCNMAVDGLLLSRRVGPNLGHFGRFIQLVQFPECFGFQQLRDVFEYPVRVNGVGQRLPTRRCCDLKDHSVVGV